MSYPPIPPPGGMAPFFFSFGFSETSV